MNSNQNLVKQLIEEESEVLHAYRDHLGYLTIGVGRLIDKKKGGGLSQEESRYLLANDISRITSALEKAVPFYFQLTDPRKAVLIGMAFQMGIAGLLKFRVTLKHIEAGDYLQASRNMKKSLWARQTPERATRMAEQMRTGTWQFQK